MPRRRNLGNEAGQRRPGVGKRGIELQRPTTGLEPRFEFPGVSLRQGEIQMQLGEAWRELDRAAVAIPRSNAIADIAQRVAEVVQHHRVVGGDRERLPVGFDRLLGVTQGPRRKRPGIQRGGPAGS